MLRGTLTRHVLPDYPPNGGGNDRYRVNPLMSGCGRRLPEKTVSSVPKAVCDTSEKQAFNVEVSRLRGFSRRSARLLA